MEATPFDKIRKLFNSFDRINLRNILECNTAIESIHDESTRYDENNDVFVNKDFSGSIRIFTLKNGIEVTVIRDLQAKDFGAALSVNVGR